MACFYKSESWTHDNVSRIGDKWNMQVFDLMYSVLNNTTPVHTKKLLGNYFSSAPCIGPYNSTNSKSNPSLI
ncbi:MAG: hypothetical protein IPH89_11000 [Bacteroidetes bacterium]|nr:hypothetical protein [Bacteroidota bacterium]